MFNMKPRLLDINFEIIKANEATNLFRSIMMKKEDMSQVATNKAKQIAMNKINEQIKFSCENEYNSFNLTNLLIKIRNDFKEGEGKVKVREIELFFISKLRSTGYIIKDGGMQGSVIVSWKK